MGIGCPKFLGNESIYNELWVETIEKNITKISQMRTFLYEWRERWIVGQTMPPTEFQILTTHLTTLNFEEWNYATNNFSTCNTPPP